MAAAFKTQFLELDLNFDEPTASPTHSHPSIGAFSSCNRIKTNGSLIRSHSAEDGHMSLNTWSKCDHDLDPISPQLKEVELLLNRYPRAAYEAEADSPSPPILLSECPEFQAYLTTSGDLEEHTLSASHEDEIVYGFSSKDRQKKREFFFGGEEEPREAEKEEQQQRVGEERDDEGALWELIEAEAEALCKVEEESKVRCLGRGTSIRSAASESNENCSTLTRSPEAKSPSVGVAALMDCAASELSRLRVGAAVLRRPSASRTSCSPPNDLAMIHESTEETQSESPQAASQRRQEKTISTTGTLASLLHIQLAQVGRMSEAVKIEFTNQLAHEKALLELLDLEHYRVRTEVRQDERRHGSAPPDLLNQLRHLQERRQQQKTLIDDLEYQYLEDKSKYEEERESLLAQLKLHEDSGPEDSHNTKSQNRHQRIAEDDSDCDLISRPRKRGFENGACTGSYEIISTASTTQTQQLAPQHPNNQKSPSPVYSTTAAINSADENPANGAEGGQNNADKCQQNGFFFADNELPSLSALAPVANNSGYNSRMYGKTEQPIQGNLSPTRQRQADWSLAQFIEQETALLPTISATSPAHQQHRGATSRAAMTVNIPVVFQHQISCDERYLQHGQTNCAVGEEAYRRHINSNPHQPSHLSPVHTNSLPGLNPPTTNSSSSSSSLPHVNAMANNDRVLSSSSVNGGSIFRAVPPLPAKALEETLLWADERDGGVDSTYLRRTARRPRTASAGACGAWNRVRPLTRYLPVPDDISFDLRHHLEVTCGHILCSPLLMPQLHVDSSTCAGYLYKIDSHVRIVEGSSQQDVTIASHISGVDHSFFSPMVTRQQRPAAAKVNFVSTLFQRSRRKGKRRWFVLDRRRRLLTYYSCQTSKSANAASLMKPKDVISFTDIIDVYPDTKTRKDNSGFCLLLVASCPPPVCTHSNESNSGNPIRTRLLSLAAPSADATSVWVDALFTCAGAYLCLANGVQTVN